MELKSSIEVMGWKVPYGTIPCWFISEQDRLIALKNNKPFADYRPSCYFRISNRLDNNFLEGQLGHSDYEGRFHTTITSSHSYFIDYQKRIPVYFSFDQISLYRFVEIIPGAELTFIIKRIDNPKAIKTNKAFMIMPFMDKALNTFYSENIKSFLKQELGIDIYRSDDFNGNDVIIETIYTQIEESEFIIAETSAFNKNVFYEFGYAAAKEKEIITIQDVGVEEQLFFDRTHIRAILYKKGEIKAFQERLKNDIVAIRQKMNSKN